MSRRLLPRCTATDPRSRYPPPPPPAGSSRPIQADQFQAVRPRDPFGRTAFPHPHSPPAGLPHRTSSWSYDPMPDRHRSPPAHPPPYGPGGPNPFPQRSSSDGMVNARPPQWEWGGYDPYHNYQGGAGWRGVGYEYIGGGGGVPGTVTGQPGMAAGGGQRNRTFPPVTTHRGHPYTGRRGDGRTVIRVLDPMANLYPLPSSPPQ